MKPQRPLLLAALLTITAFAADPASGQRTKYWVGGSGHWSNAAHWSLNAGGTGGAGAPRTDEHASILGQGGITLTIDGDARCLDLNIDGAQGGLTIAGDPSSTVSIGGGFRAYGTISWLFTGGLVLLGDGGTFPIDAHGVRMASDVTLSGDADYELRSALVTTGDLILREGTFRLFDGVVETGAFRTEQRARKRIEAGNAFVSTGSLGLDMDRTTISDGGSMVVVNGALANWDGTARDAEELRGITNCGAGPGQTPFQVNAFVTSSFIGGFGVSCNGACDGAVNVSVTGGTGNFSIQWSGGPNCTPCTSLPWTSLCAGNKLVIVTDIGQNVGCFASTLINPPPPLGVIFFGLNPPTCADVCNGTAVTFPGGGAGSGYVYNWNNNTETSSNPVQLCAGVNTLQLRDTNLCVFDTSFTIDLQPLLAALTFTDALCSGDCNGTGHVDVSGGTPQYDYDWEPGTPTGDGTTDVSGLCPGNWSVLVTDANGCDTTISFTIADPPPITPDVTFVDATCFSACDGSAGAAPSGAAGPFTYDWGPGTINGDGTPNVSDLCAGDYTVLITDQATGCDTLVQFTIGSAPAIDVQLTVTGATCSGDCDGAADIVVSGGTPGYTILWGPGTITGQGTPNATQLCPGDYTVTVTDAVGCDTTLQFTIAQPPPILPNETFTDVRCFGQCNGTIDLAPTGGTGSYTYVWAPPPLIGDGTASGAGLCAQDWSITIADSLGCDTSVTITINQPPQLIVAPTQTNITCGANCDGTAGVTVSGGSPDYTYDWSGSPAGDGTNAVNGLCAGVYTVQVLDSALCEVIQTFIIEAPLPIDVVVTTADATCPDFCNGTADATVSGGNDPYTFVWSPGVTGQGTPNASGLCAQDYTLTVTDSVGCDTSVTFTISAPLPVDAQDSVTNVSCAGSCDGSILLNPLGGAGIFTYTWVPEPPNGPGTQQATGLCAGTWSVTISDGVCDTTLVFDITEPLPIDAGLVITPAGCDGACDGTATSTTSGGTPGYIYVWSPAPGAGQGSPAASQLCPGNYTLTITDAAGCDTTISFIITQPPAILPTITTTVASCGGPCDGSATVGFTGGTGTITIVWTPEPLIGGQGTTSATGFCPGTGSVTLTDSLGCDTTVQFIINTPSGIVAVPTVSDASCSDLCDGTITLSVSGGVPGYDFTWTPPPQQGADSSISALCPGQWTVQIGDQAGCDTTLVMTIGAPSPILPNGTFTNETCNGPCDGTASLNPTGGAGGYTYSWSPVPPCGAGTSSSSCLCAGDWSVTITDASGCDTTWAFTILPEQPILPDLTVTDATCFNICNGAASVAPTGGSGGFTYLWTPQPPQGQGTDSVSGLCLGLWNVTITDSVGCDTTVSFIVSKPPPLTTSLAFNAATCAGPCTGEAASFPSGGTPGYTFFWQPEPGSGQGEFYVDGLCAGTTYSLTVTDTLGCDTTDSFTIPAYAPIIPNLSTTPATCSGVCDGTATVSPTGGSGVYTYNWEPAPQNGDSTNTASGLCPGVYDVTIADADGCDTVVSILITSPPEISLSPVVTPVACNGDCNGSIALGASGGSGTLSFIWSPQPPAGQGTENASQLCPGDWSVTITDSLGCDTTVNFTLTDPPVLTTSAEVVQSQCQACDGSITVHVSGGGGGYFFAWGPPINQTTADSVQANLCAGIYTVIIGDASGCVTQIAVPVGDSDGEDLTISNDTVTCPTDCDGTVSVDFNCSAPACAIAWFDGLGTNLNASNNSLNGLCAGLYLVQVTNGDGCLTIDSALVVAPTPITAQFGTTPASCAGVCDGIATLGINGGVPPYVVVWSPLPGSGQGTPNAGGLCAGTYDATITDDNGCSITASVLILGPAPIDANATVQDLSCAGVCDGSILLNTQGGSGTFSYVWDPQPPNGQGGGTATQLCAGVSVVTIVDGNGCDTTLTFTVAEPQPLTLTPSSTPAHCQVCDGTGTIAVSGGTGTVVITWTDDAGTVVGSGTALTGLCAGIYTATGQDTNGCAAQAVVVISDAAGETLSVTDGQTSCANNCDGAVSVSFTCLDGPCTISWFDGGGTLLAQNQFTLEDLCTGDYFVQVSNDAGCTVIDTASVQPSQTLIANLGTTQVTCTGACDGTATVGPAGGVAPYTFDWGPGPITGDGTPTVTGLCAGTYTLLLADSSGCDTVINVLILEPTPIAVIAQVNDASCNATCDGAISVITSGGTGILSYLWDPVPPVGQGTANASELCAGVWTVLISDDAGCDTSITFTIVEPSPLTISATSTQSTCGICSGTMTVTPAGGTPGYVYAWTQNGAIYGTDSLLSDVCAGLYQVSVTDANGCQAQQAVPVSDADGEILTATNDIVTCPGSCDGAVSVDLICSVPNCTISWYDGQGTGLGESGPLLDSLCASSYFVQVINGNGCLSVDTALVTEPQAIQPNLGTTPPLCAGGCEGTAQVAPSGGVGPYTYDWSPNPITGDSTSSVTDLCGGIYSVLITDSVGCLAIVDVIITEPQPISATGQVTAISCNGACDGAILLTSTGGTGQLDFLWSPDPEGQGTDSVYALCAGEWNVIITDGNGCDSSFFFALTDPPALIADVSAVDNPCFGDCIGTATASVSGGTGSYVLTWTTSSGTLIAQGDTSVSGLCSGDYILNVSDSSGCAVQVPFTISEGNAITATLAFTGETCNGPCDGVASVQPGGGAGGYTITWTGPDGNTFASDTTDVSGLCAGNWSVTILDPLGCDSTFAFTLLPYVAIASNGGIEQVTCNAACDGSVTLAASGGIGPLTFAWDPIPPNVDPQTGTATGLCPGDWSLTITDAVQCDTTVVFNILEPPAITIAIDEVVNASCNTAADGAISTTIDGGTPGLDVTWTGPGSFSADTADISSLVPGEYILIIEDANNCSVQQEVTVGALSTVIAAAGEDISQCFGAVLILNGASSQGAANYVWSDTQGATLGTQPLLDLGTPSPGAYTYLLTVSDGPCEDTDTILVNILSLPFANAGQDQDIFVDGTVNLGGQPAGPSGSSFLWSPDSLMADATLPNPVVSPGATTLFILQVTTPSGCTSADSVLITVVPEIVIPSGFTPNGDGANDVWQIDFIDRFPDCTVEVYNRWGEQLFRSVGYGEPWDGTYSGGLVPVGTYYYAIELNDARFPDPYTGPLTVIR